MRVQFYPVLEAQPFWRVAFRLAMGQQIWVCQFLRFIVEFQPFLTLVIQFFPNSEVSPTEERMTVLMPLSKFVKASKPRSQSLMLPLGV